MFKILEVEDVVRVRPEYFSMSLEEAIVAELEDAFVGTIERDVGIILAIVGLKEVGEGRIIAGDGAVYYDTRFEVLVYQPIIDEVVEGIVTEVVSFGALVNFGPMDGLLHISQIMDDEVTYDAKNQVLRGKETGRVLKVGDLLRARIVMVSLKSRFRESKVGLTMRQPYLGKLEWIEEERKKAEKAEKG